MIREKKKKHFIANNYYWVTCLLGLLVSCDLKASYIAEDGKSGTFVIGNDHFPASLLDLPCVVESYKTYDDSVLIKSANVGQVKCSLALSLST
jgi:hypothetical protein